MQDRPTAAELLAAVAEFLERDVMTLDGRVGFHGRVARNVVEVVRRELEYGPEADAAERRRLEALLGDTVGDGVGGLREANAELARRIRRGDLDDDRDELIAHLRQTAIDKLRIANPRELGPRELGPRELGPRELDA